MINNHDANSTANKENKTRKKTLSIQIFDEEVCKIEAKSIISENLSQNRNFSKASNSGQIINSNSLILSETISDVSIQTFRISKNSLVVSNAYKAENYSLISEDQDKKLNPISNLKDVVSSNFNGNKDELDLGSIIVEDRDVMTSAIFTRNDQSNLEEIMNKSCISNHSVIAINQEKKSEAGNKSIFCTPNTICNYYLRSNDVTPNKLCYNAVSNYSYGTDAFNSVSARSSNQDLKSKFPKINILNTNSNNPSNNFNGSSNSNTLAGYEDSNNDHIESNFNSTRNNFDKRTPIKYTKSQLRTEEKENVKGTYRDSGSSNKNPSSSIAEMLKINSKPIDERFSLIAKEIKKNLNISELDIDKEEDRNIDPKNLSYSNGNIFQDIDSEINLNTKTVETNDCEMIGKFPDVKNLNSAFDQIKNDKEHTNLENNRLLHNVEDNKSNDLTINLHKYENFSFDITFNKAIVNKINNANITTLIPTETQLEGNLNHNLNNEVQIINKENATNLMNQHSHDHKSYKHIESPGENKLVQDKHEASGIKILNRRVKRIDSYSFGSINNNNNLINLTSICNNLQQSRENIIDKLSNNLKKFNLHPDLKSLFKKTKSHKEFSNNNIGDTNLDINEEKNTERLNIEIKPDKEEVKKFEMRNCENKSNSNVDNYGIPTSCNNENNINFISHKTLKNSETKTIKTSEKITPNLSTTDHKKSADTMPSTDKSKKTTQDEGPISKMKGNTKDLSEFQINKLKLNTNSLLKKEEKEIHHNIGKKIKEIVIKDKEKISSNCYFSPGETKKNSTSPRYNTKKTHSLQTNQFRANLNNGAASELKKKNFIDLMKIYKNKGGVAFINKGISPINNKYNSYTKSLSKSRINANSFTTNNNSYARSNSRNDSNQKTIEVTFQADQTTGNQSYIKIQNSVNKTQDSKIISVGNESQIHSNRKNFLNMDSYRSAGDNSKNKYTQNDDYLKSRIKSRISNMKNVIPIQSSDDKSYGIIKSMKNMNKNDVDNFSNSGYNSERILKQDADIPSHGDSNIINKIKLNTQIRNGQNSYQDNKSKIKQNNSSVDYKINSKNFANCKVEEDNKSIQTNIQPYTKIEESIKSKMNHSIGDINKSNKDANNIKNLINLEKRGSSNKIDNINTYININNKSNTNNIKNIQVISNFSNYTKKKTTITDDTKANYINYQEKSVSNAYTIKPKIFKKEESKDIKDSSSSNKINNSSKVIASKDKTLKILNDGPYTSYTNKAYSTLTTRIQVCHNKNKLEQHKKTNEAINKQIVSSKIKYLTGDDDFVFFDE